MSVEADLRTYLLTLGTVTALVGTGASARIRPDRLQQSDDEKQPAIIIEVDDEVPLNTLDGKGGRRYADVTLRCRARQKQQSRALSEAVRLNGTDPGTGLAGYSGTMGSGTYDAWLDDEQTSFTPDLEGGDQGYYEVFSNYKITFAEVI